MNNGPNGDHRFDGIEVRVLQAQLSNERQRLVDLLLADVPDVQVHIGTVRSVQRASLLLFLNEGLRQPVTRTEFHGAQHRRGLRFAEVVILEVTVTLLIEEPTPFGTRGFGNQDSGCRQPRGGILDEFHVL